MLSTAERPVAERAGTECPECLTGNLKWLLAQAHYGFARELHAAFQPLGISPRDYLVLGAALTGAHTQTEIADMVGLDKTTMVVTLDELERAGLATRMPSRTDRRARVIAVTRGGKRKVAAGDSIVAETQAEVLSVLSAREREVFLQALGKLVRTRLAEPAACRTPMRRREPRG